MRPVLYPAVRSALAAIYSHEQQGSALNKEQHEFLVRFQRASTKRGNKQQQNENNSSNSYENLIKRGSTFLCCMYILAESCRSDDCVHDYEKIFMAQTIVSRLRSMSTLEEAFDLEKECQQQQPHASSILWNNLKIKITFRTM